MNLTVVIDWKVFAAIGATVAGVLLAEKIDGTAAERVLAELACSCRDLAVVKIND